MRPRSFVSHRFRRAFLYGWLVVLFVTGLQLSACSMTSRVLAGTATWKEEVELHDGTRLIVRRHQEQDPHGVREPFRPAPLGEVVTEIPLPGSDKTIVWKSEYGPDPKKNGLALVGIDVVDGELYVVTSFHRCYDYSKWGRPKLPYVFFKYVDDKWIRIGLDDLPEQIDRENVVSYLHVRYRSILLNSPYLPVEDKSYWLRAGRPHSIRGMVGKGEANPNLCEKLIYYKGNWVGPGDTAAIKFIDNQIRNR